MARPEHYTEGSAPNRNDTKQRILSKVLGRVQDDTSGSAENDPQPNDTKWTLKRKLNRALTS